MPTNLRPRRGKRSTMLGPKSNIILQSGEMFIELPDNGPGTGPCKMKIGNGTDKYTDLQYALGGDLAEREITGAIIEDTSEDVETALANISTNHTIGAIIGSIRRVLELNIQGIDNRYPIGTIIHSTKYSTEAEVIKHYGGNSWKEHKGYFLRGRTDNETVKFDTATKTNGSDDAVVVTHTHGTDTQGGHTHSTVYDMVGISGNGLSQAWYAGGANASHTVNGTFTDNKGSHSHTVNAPAGAVSGSGKNVPNYKAVYIWERIS